MENYSLQSNESLLYQGHISRHLNTPAFTDVTSELLLTNLNLVVITKTKKMFSKEQVSVDVNPVENIKIYNDVPQIKHNGTKIEIFLANKELSFDMDSKGEANKFLKLAYDLLTGQTASERGAKKVKGAIHLVDDTLGIETVGTVKNILENGIAGTLFGGFKHKAKGSSSKSSVKTEALNVAKDILVTQADTPKENTKPALSYDEQIDMLNKLKGLLDAGILTEDEFNAKKKEILNL